MSICMLSHAVDAISGHLCGHQWSSVATNVVISGHQWPPMWSSVAISATWSIKEPKARAIVTPRPLGPLTSPRDRIHVRTPCLHFLASEGIQSSEPFVDVGHRRTCGERARRGEHMHAGQSCSLGLRRTLTGHDADGLWMNGAINCNQGQSRAIKGDRTSPGHDADGLWMNAAVYEDHRT